MRYNPFSPGGVVKTTLFGGRTEYILRILKRLNSVKHGRPTSFYLFGERGIGKTALAKLISFISEESEEELFSLNFLTSYYSVQHNQSFRSVLESSLNNIADQMENSILAAIGRRLGGVFKNGKFSIGAFGIKASYESGGSESIPTEPILIKDQVVSIIRNILREITSQHDETSKDGILVIIDEMDNISDLDTAASIIRGITAELDFEDLGFISFLLIGYKSGLEKFARGDESIRRLLDPIQLTEMSDNEVVETFEKGFSAAEIKWDKEILKKKVWITGGYPLAIQIIGYHTVEADNDNFIDEIDWEKSVVDSHLELIDKEYSSYYSFGVKKKKNSDKVLLALAIGARMNCNTLSVKEIEHISGVKNPSQYLKMLMKNGIVLRDVSNNEYCLRKGLLGNSIVLDLILTYGSEKGYEFYEKIKSKVSNIARKKVNNGDRSLFSAFESETQSLKKMS
ncbi:MAG: AAA family ATPase [bacterium]